MWSEQRELIRLAARSRMASARELREGFNRTFALAFNPSMPGIKPKVRAAMNALRVAVLVAALVALYRRRQRIRNSLSGGFGSLRRTASNLNDLLFSSSSLATAFAKDLKTFLYSDAGPPPKSLHRLIGLLCSDEVQKSIHGTSQTLLAAFFAARRKEAEDRRQHGETEAVDALLRTGEVLLDKLFTPAGHEYTDKLLKSASASFLSIYLSLPASPPAPQDAPNVAVQLAGTVLDKLSSPAGRQLVIAAVGAFTNAAAPALVSGMSGGSRGDETEKNGASANVSASPVLEMVLEWLAHPATRDNAEKLLCAVSSTSVSAAVNSYMLQSRVAQERQGADIQKSICSPLQASEREEQGMVGERRAHTDSAEKSPSFSRCGVAASVEAEHNPTMCGPYMFKQHVLPGGVGGKCVGGVPLEVLFAVAEQSACRGMVVEVAGTCTRECVLAVMQGVMGKGPRGPHVLLCASWESFVLLTVLALMASLTQGAALVLCVLVLVGWCCALLVLRPEGLLGNLGIERSSCVSARHAHGAAERAVSEGDT